MLLFSADSTRYGSIGGLSKDGALTKPDVKKDATGAINHLRYNIKSFSISDYPPVEVSSVVNLINFVRVVS